MEESMTDSMETRCIHGSGNMTKHHPFGAVSVPIYYTATFAHPGVGESSGYDYSRQSNPTRTELENLVFSLEGAENTFACSSGMAAIGLVLELFGRGDEILCTEDLYGGSVRIFDTVGKKNGLKFRYIDTSDSRTLEKEIRPETKAVYIETPSNPTMLVTDIRKAAAIASEHGMLVIVDNTFLSPYFQNPLLLGADLVIHSGTKFLAGHNDTIAGFVCTSDRRLAEKISFLYKTIGCCLSPFDSFMVIRGIKTLAVRMEKQQANAVKTAEWLKKQSFAAKVDYVGLPNHPGYEINRKQSRGSGSMISFETKDSAMAVKILENIGLFSYAESLGGVESLITYPILQTHADVDPAVRERLGITDRFLRLSVGIENADDLIEDLRQAAEG